MSGNARTPFAVKCEFKLKPCPNRRFLILFLRYGRHSKSIDPSTQVCGRCKGQLKPLFDTQKPPAKKSAYQGMTGIFVCRRQTYLISPPEFMKENLKILRETHPGISMSEAMKLVGERWKASRGDITDRAGGADEMVKMAQRLEALKF